MSFRAMGMTNFLLLLGGVWVAVVALYLLKLRRPKVVVPFAQLWHIVLAEGERRTLFDRLRNVSSLLLQLLLVTLIVLALADPQFGLREKVSHRTVIIIDGSASMTAKTRDGREAFEIAVADAESRARSALASGEVSVVLAAMTSEPLTTFTADMSTVAASLKRARPIVAPTDMTGAFAYARAALGGTPKPKVLIFTDRALTDMEKNALGDIPYEISGAGPRDPNAGITRFAVRRLPASPLAVEGILTVRLPPGFSEELEIRIEDVTTEPIPVEIVKANGNLERTIRFTTEKAMKLRARLTRPGGKDYIDSLSADNRAFAWLPAAQKKSVLVVGANKPDFFLAGALTSNPLIDAQWIKLSEYEGRRRPDIDVIIFDNVLPTALPEGPTIFLNPPDKANSVLRVRESVPLPRTGPALGTHPLMRGVSLEDINLESASVIEPSAGDLTLLRSDGESQAPLIFLRPEEGHWWLVVCFDLSVTELPLRADFPLLISNAVGFLTGSADTHPGGVSSGRAWAFDVPPGVSSVELLSPSGKSWLLPAAHGSCAFTPLETGFYKLKFADREIVTGSNLDSENETRFAGDKAPARIPPGPGAHALGASRLWALLILAAFAGIALEWFTYNRRYTS